MTTKSVREEIADKRKRHQVRTRGQHPYAAELIKIDLEIEELVRKRDLGPDDEVRANALFEQFDEQWKAGVTEMVRNGSAIIDRPTNADGSDFDLHAALDSGQNFGARSDAMRAIDAAVRSKALPEYAADKVEKLVTDGPQAEQSLAQRWVTVTGASAYRSAFAKLCADPERGHLLWSEQERQAYQHVEEFRSFQRAMSLTDNAGGYLVPFQIDPAIILTSSGSINPLRKISRVVQAVGDVWHGVTSAGVTAEWLGEAMESADASPTLGQPSVPVYKGAAFVPFSFEVGMDGLHWMEELSKLLRDGADQLQATAFTTGSGSGQPTGIVTAIAGTASELNATADDTFAAGDVYRVQEALPPRFQPNAQWCANIAILNKIAQFESTNGARLFAEHDVLLRKPLNELSNMDGAIGTSGAVSNFVLLYGDFSNFVIADRIGTSIELLPHLFGENGRPTGQRGAWMAFRTGSDSVNDAAFRLLDVASAS